LKKEKTLQKESKKTLSNECTELSEEAETKSNDLDAWISKGVDKDFVSTLEVFKAPEPSTSQPHSIPVEHESDMNLELSSNIVKLYSHLKIICDKSNGLFKPQALDLMFIMDCTSSMGSWIKSCKQEIETIVTRITAISQGCDVRLSFVGYTDFD